MIFEFTSRVVRTIIVAGPVLPAKVKRKEVDSWKRSW
jgi:hypothetical protein